MGNITATIVDGYAGGAAHGRFRSNPCASIRWRACRTHTPQPHGTESGGQKESNRYRCTALNRISGSKRLANPVNIRTSVPISNDETV
jgi:hypothetical protein